MKKELEYHWRYLAALREWLWRGVTRKPFEWQACNDGDPDNVDYVEPWNKQVWMAIRPRYLKFIKNLPCGCSRRFGRMVLYNMRCKEHGFGNEID